MPPASKRAPAAKPPAGPALSASPLSTALLISASIGYGVWLLVDRGRLAWPPTDLLANASTLAGCLALVAPIILAKGRSDSALGEMLWMTGGLLVWTFDALALFTGGFRAVSWASPLNPQTMGLTILAVGAASWRLHGSGRSWAWTNVVGWVLGLFWVSLALLAMMPPGPLRMVSR
jgi:hypothetical protein